MFMLAGAHMAAALHLCMRISAFAACCADLYAFCFMCGVPSFLQEVVFPLYDQVKSEHVVPGMRALFKQLHAEIDALEASGVFT
jgi:hypothetical protein